MNEQGTLAAPAHSVSWTSGSMYRNPRGLESAVMEPEAVPVCEARLKAARARFRGVVLRINRTRRRSS